MAGTQHDDVDAHVCGILAKSMWLVDNKDKDFTDPEHRNQAFQEDRTKYMIDARQVYRQMSRLGVVMKASDEINA